MKTNKIIDYILSVITSDRASLETGSEEVTEEPEDKSTEVDNKEEGSDIDILEEFKTLHSRVEELEAENKKLKEGTSSDQSALKAEIAKFLGRNVGSAPTREVHQEPTINDAPESPTEYFNRVSNITADDLKI